MMGSRHARADRVGIAVFALAAACAHLSGALHHLLVAHVHCAEHGELVHGHVEGVHAPAAPVAAGDAVRGLSGAHAGHEHCDAAASGRGDLAFARAAALAAPSVLHHRADPVCCVGAPRAPLERAPKTSPPA